MKAGECETIRDALPLSLCLTSRETFFFRGCVYSLRLAWRVGMGGFAKCTLARDDSILKLVGRR